MIEYKLIKLVKYQFINLFEIEIFKNKLKFGFIKFNFDLNKNITYITSLEVNDMYSYNKYAIKEAKNIVQIMQIDQWSRRVIYKKLLTRKYA